jgi:hypothetical protein
MKEPGCDTVQDSKRAMTITQFATKMRNHFGRRASDAAWRQFCCATGSARSAWKDVLEKLSRS